MKRAFNQSNFDWYIEEIKQFTEIDHKNIINQIIKNSITYKELILSIQQQLNKGLNWSKQLLKIWLQKNYIYKNKSNLYEKRF
jgi:hypothetical protein